VDRSVTSLTRVDRGRRARPQTQPLLANRKQRWVWARGLLRDFVRARPGRVLRRLDLLAALSAEDAHEPADRVSLPTGRVNDRLQGCAARALHQRDDLGLLVASLGFPWWATSRKLNRRTATLFYGPDKMRPKSAALPVSLGVVGDGPFYEPTPVCAVHSANSHSMSSLCGFSPSTRISAFDRASGELSA
jgi:hypothetical protein